MSLESEFAAICSSTAAYEQLYRSLPCAHRFTPSMWVQLLKLPTAYSSDQALLLCQCAEDQWLAWIPDYGELWLTTDQFCSLTNE